MERNLFFIFTPYRRGSTFRSSERGPLLAAAKGTKRCLGAKTSPLAASENFSPEKAKRVPVPARSMLQYKAAQTMRLQ